MADNDELPTYANLEEREGGSARWNRWRGWIEKRAAERYADDENPRRPTGWGESFDYPQQELVQDRPKPVRQSTQITIQPPDYSSALPPPPVGETLEPCHIALHHFGSRFLPHATDPITSILHLPSVNFVLIGTRSGLSVLDPQPSLHTDTSGLSAATSDPPLSNALTIPIWKGEAVYQLSLLEQATEEAFNPAGPPSSPQGVVLALVGTDDDEANRAVRMYSLSSLMSLVRWAVSSKNHEPIDLGRMSTSGSPSKTLRKSRPHTLTRPFRQLLIDQAQASQHHSSSSSTSNRNPTVQPYRLGPATSNPSGSNAPNTRRPPPKDTPSSYTTVSATPSTAPPYAANSSPTNSRDSLDSTADSTWDFVDDMPIRWAQDYVPLASGNSRLSNVPVSFFEIYKGLDGKGSIFLAIATRSNILLYEAPKGERLFKYVKEFYTPLAAKSITFVNQRDTSHSRHSSSSHVQTLGRSGSSGRESGSRHGHSHSRSSKSVDYGIQLCLFVTFDKKAGLIRVGDAAVTEVESFPDIASSNGLSASNTSDPISPGGGSFRRSLQDAASFWRSSIPWLPLIKLKIPAIVYSSLSVALTSMNSSGDKNSDGYRLRTLDEVCFLTRGRTTQILPVPLPVAFGAYHSSSPTTAPYKTLTWSHQHTHIRARVSFDSPPGSEAIPGGTPPKPCLQLIGFGEDGVEVLEFSFAFLVAPASASKGKGKVVSHPLLEDRTFRAFGDLGGGGIGGGQAGFLCEGGEWEKTLNEQYLSKLYPTGRPPFPDNNSSTSLPSTISSTTKNFTVIGADYLPAVVASPTQDFSIASALSSLSTASSTYVRSDRASPTLSNVSLSPVEARARKVSGMSNMGLGLEKGLYGWCSRGPEDYRVFWLGGGVVGAGDNFGGEGYGSKPNGKLFS
ncbi:hypothetical protein FRC03_012662 [Tulasnella sp. 419]|nr:hypothetical protein FRC03_012662 [Tulasnella sp. 419]